jgi:hypothetical protein
MCADYSNMKNLPVKCEFDVILLFIGEKLTLGHLKNTALEIKKY